MEKATLTADCTVNLSLHRIVGIEAYQRDPTCVLPATQYGSLFELNHFTVGDCGVSSGSESVIAIESGTEPCLILPEFPRTLGYMMPQTPEELTPSMADHESPTTDTFTLKVVSPSTGATGPLSFLQLSTRTTVEQLKHKIREALPMKPSDENQRLIHRGRMLARETETMAEIFGQETLKNSDSQTLHLVLRPAPINSANSSTISHQTTSNEGPRAQVEALFADHGAGPAIARTPQLQGGEHASPLAAHIHGNFHAPILERLQNMQRLQELQRTEERLRGEIQALEQQHLTLSSDTASTPDPTYQGPRRSIGSLRNVLAQHRDRAAAEAQQTNSYGVPQFPQQMRLPHQHAQGQRHPNRSTTFTQQVFGPNGERWHATVSQTTSTVSSVPQHSSQQQTDAQMAQTPGMQSMVQAILSGADQGRIAHNAVPNTLMTSNPIVAAIPGTDAGQPANLAAVTGTANLTAVSSTAVVDSDTALRPSLPNLSLQAGPTVYILFSPNGPRAILVAPSADGHDNFFMPSQNQSNPITYHPNSLLTRQLQADIDGGTRRHRRRERQARQNHAEAVPPNGDAVAPPQLQHAHHPNAAAANVQLWPHIWLLFRLVGFVWFFTSNNSSWWRIFMVSSIAIVVFLYNTGIFDTIFNGIEAQVWNPIRGHLEALLPLAEPEPAAPAPAAAANRPAAVAEGALPEATNHRAPELDPSQVAARLLARRRQADGNWLWTQFRRVEHTTILFLASLIPGVGERHIAARAAEENIVMEAERQRQAAAAAAEVTAVLSNTVAETGPEPGITDVVDGNGVDGGDDADLGNDEAPV